MTRDLMIKALRDRSVVIPGREAVQPILGNLRRTLDAVLRDRFIYPSPSRGEPALPMGTTVPRQEDLEETKRAALMVDARKAHCLKERCSTAQRRTSPRPAR